MTVPRSLTGKYQLVVLGQEGNLHVNECGARLVTAVGHAFDKLGVSKTFLVSLMPAIGEAD
jgi:hypothetical protein